MPPAIQSTMQVSAVGRGWTTGSSERAGRGSPPARAAIAAALMPRRKSRRLGPRSVCDVLVIVGLLVLVLVLGPGRRRRPAAGSSAHRLSGSTGTREA